jgi:hypothetical protein
MRNARFRSDRILRDISRADRLKPRRTKPRQARFTADDAAAPRGRFTRRLDRCQSATAEMNLNAVFSGVSL